MRNFSGEGGCLCGSVRYRVDGALLWTGYCHCETCRRQTSSPVTVFFCMRAENVMFSGDAPVAYRSSDSVERGFCGKCGTPLYYKHHGRPDEIDLYTESLDLPETLVPNEHYHWKERLPWLSIHDDFKKHHAEES